MIEVEHLTKRYGGFTALHDVTFQVGRGEVVGFLGPNGAGKSTTMRILCGCIGASSGRARLAGGQLATGCHRCGKYEQNRAWRARRDQAEQP